MKFYQSNNEEVQLIIPLISLLNGTKDIQTSDEKILSGNIGLEFSKNSRIEKTENNEIGWLF